MMHRMLAISLLLFWGVVFGGLAHVTLSGMQEASPVAIAFALHHLPLAQLSASMMMLVAVLFGWAVLALVTDELQGFREVETVAYAAGIVALSVIVVATLARPAEVPGAASIFAASLAVSAASSWTMNLERKPETGVSDVSRAAARRMAIGAAHNSMLARVSGRQNPETGGNL
jgi:hypothetical protein